MMMRMMIIVHTKLNSTWSDILLSTAVEGHFHAISLATGKKPSQYFIIYKYIH